MSSTIALSGRRLRRCPCNCQQVDVHKTLTAICRGTSSLPSWTAESSLLRPMYLEQNSIVSWIQSLITCPSSSPRPLLRTTVVLTFTESLSGVHSPVNNIVRHDTVYKVQFDVIVLLFCSLRRYPAGSTTMRYVGRQGRVQKSIPPSVFPFSSLPHTPGWRTID